MPEYLLDFNRTQLHNYLQAQNQPSYRADQILKGVYVKNYASFQEFTDLPKTFRTQLEQDFALRTFTEIDRVRSDVDGTTKFLWQLRDGLKIESVIIYEKRRVTFCISSQVGCPLDCKFCATGKMGLLRNLTPGEIVEQVLQMKAVSERPPTNIVFMGMGEPLLNYENVMAAADILSDPEGLGFSRKKITISTAGIAKNIIRMADDNRPYSLAVSLNAVTQETRERIMPIARKYSLDELMEAVKYYTRQTKKRVTFEYVLMDNINASRQDAHALIRLTRGIPCKINVIPCNTDDPLYKPPGDEVIQEFDQIVNKGQRTITIRNRKGWEIQAACGQLYAKNERQKKKTTFKQLNLTRI